MNLLVHSDMLRSTLAIGIGLAVVAAGCGEKELSAKPEIGSKAPTFATEPSKIGALVSIPISEISALVNSKVPSSFSASGNGSDACVKVGYRIPTPFGDIKDEKNVCAGTKYELSANRGAVSLSPAGTNAIQISVPVAFSGAGGFRGDVASAIKVDKKNFTGAVVVDAVLAPKVTKDWCPQLDASASIRWTSNPRVEIVGGVWVDLKSQVEGKVKEKIPELLEQAKAAIDCDKFKRTISAVYGSRAIPLDIEGGEKVSLNIQPVDIGFSGLAVEGSIVKAAVLVTTNVEVSSTPAAVRTLPLPELKEIPASVPEMTLKVPLRLTYPTLESQISKAVEGKTFERDTSAGKVSVKLTGVSVYPSNNRVVIGLKTTADLPGSWFDTKGTIYLVATPIVKEGTVIQFLNASYAQTLDNKFWATVAVVFEGQIKETIDKNSTFDLAPQIAQAKKLVAEKLRDPAAMPGVRANVEGVDMKVGRLAIAERELAVEGVLKAKVSLEPAL